MEFRDDDTFRQHFGDELTCLETLWEHGALRDQILCPTCGGNTSRVMRIDSALFRCRTKKCNKRSFSCRAGSVFYDSGLKCTEIMRIARCWLQKESREAAVVSAKQGKKAVTTWYRTFRQMATDAVEFAGCKIGGNNIIVEIDETKLGKRKYNRGHRVEGVWVLVGIERTPERRVFCQVVPNRSAETLRAVISSHVNIGSQVHTDGWRGYIGIEDACGVKHLTVNHSRHFVNPETGVCTNTVEGLNSALKAGVISQHRTARHADAAIGAFVWRRLNKGRLCEAFMEALALYVERNKD